MFDEWDAKALAERIARTAFPEQAVELRPASDGGGDGLLWELARAGGDGGSADAIVGVVRRVTLDAPVWAAPAFGVEVTLARLDSADVAPPGRAAWHGVAEAPVGHAASPRGRYHDLPTTPAVEIDLALLVAEGVAAAAVERTMRNAAGPLLESVIAFDEYRGDTVPAGHRSVAWRLTFRDRQRTLGAKEVEARKERVLRTLETELGVRQRAL
jgi:phenylalanyl-tRNA synthetase beta chain